MSATWKVILGWIIVLLIVLILLFSWPTPLLSSALSAQTPTPLPSALVS